MTLEKQSLWKIALIDDDFQVLRGMRKVIPWDELHAIFAGEAISGEDGIKLVEETQPDIIITDLYMPGMNGIEMIEELRNQSYQGSIVILSGYSDFEHARKALKLNVEDYINKPVTVDQIHDVLSNVIGRMEETLMQRIEHNDLKKSIQSYEGLFMQEWLNSVISGTAYESEDSIPPTLALKEQWSSQYHMVSVVEIINNTRIQGITLTDLNLFKFAVNNIIQELLRTHWPESHFLQLYGNHFVILLHWDQYKSKQKMQERAAELCRMIADNIEEYLNLKARIGIGNIKEYWREIHFSADEAFQALLMKQFSEQMGAEHDLPSFFSFYQRLSSAMAKYNEEEIMIEIKNYFDQLEKTSQIQSHLFYRVMAAEIWALFQYSLHQSGSSLLTELDERTNIIEYDGISNREKLEDWISPKIKMYCLEKQPAINQKHKKAVDFMIQYIHKHYSKDITLDGLANQLYISKNYLNQLFKKVTGETFMNYVIRVRMQKAKSLLIEGEYLVYEISEMVGYQNVPYFSTLFKKHCGVNPSELTKNRQSE